ncbi:MAG: carboxylating nicotinate-nucleotide diphosphorylase [Promethearchaeota archaeon]
MEYNKIIIKRKLREFLEEDCRFKDVSSAFIPESSVSSAKIIAKSDGFVSGLEELNILYNILNVNVNTHIEDGEKVKNGDRIATLEGNTRDILLGERVGLNILTHMSAITTTTRHFVNIIQNAGKKTKIACTRKTIPGMRIFEKRAVEIGGGDTHRMSLDDMILLKDTHLKFYDGNIQKLLKDVKQRASFSKKIELEVEKVDDAIVAVKNGIDIVMLDNMSPNRVKQAIDDLIQENLRERTIIEISGGVTAENIEDYLVAEPDIISSSQLTQFPSKKVDLSLRFL